ncbi:MAG: NAD(P)/FAD-dependent oxidoreductase [Bacteroidia bacterium]|nr:NAD(P)/FAD-dependent oxidoreductase [Bacteroidia bacterium]
MRIGIIGGGFMGLALAKELAGPGHELKVFERDTQLGGLATYHDYGDFYFDRFYHVILPTDTALTGFLEEIGLGDKLRWKQTFTGYYVNRKFYSISNSKEFLLFPPLDLISKFRLALTILIGSRIDDWRKMEKITIEEWLVKIGGRKTFEKFWKPLLLAKLGENYKRVSAVFIWTYIKRLFEAREANSAAKQEHMGYVEGGYKTVFDHLERWLAARGCTIATGTAVEAIRPAEGGGLYVTADGVEEHFDKVVFTSPVNVLEQTADASLVNISGNSRQVEYLGVICMVMATKTGFTPFYVLNLADERVPFTGVIGMSTLVDRAETGGHELTYFPKYVISTDPLLRKSDEELKTLFLSGVKTMYPELRDEDIVSVHINRAFKVQALQVLNYSEIVPQVRTQHPDFYVLNTSQFVNDTLNNNSVAKHVKRFAEQFGADFRMSPQPAAGHGH